MLLSIRADLLKDIDQQESAAALEDALEYVDASMSVREVVDLALRKDENLKKLRIVQVFLHFYLTQLRHWLTF